MTSPTAPGDGDDGGGGAPIDLAQLEEWALSYLARYASSAEHLRWVLRRRAGRRLGLGLGLGDDREERRRAADLLIDALVARYREAGLLDDAAYAAASVRRDLARGRSLRQVAARLGAKGVEAADAAAALAALREEAVADPELAAACAFAKRRRLGPFRARPRPADHERELAAFARAGFTPGTAQAVLACADEAAVAALLGRED
jgi:regulatory protein